MATNEHAETAYAIILAGGNGERLWPLSTPEEPKQFVELFGGKPLIRHAVDRLSGLIPPERVLVVTSERFVGRTRKALPQVPAANICGEPCRRDTAAAVAVACGLVRRLGGADAVGCILTADQLIEPADRFRRTLADAISVAAESDNIVTMGIKPTFPASEFGYIESGDSLDFGTETPFRKVVKFVEKPDTETAKEYLATGLFSWNAGMFVWKAAVMDAAFAAFAPDIGRLVGKVAAAGDVCRVLGEEYPGTRSTSIDYAIMEKADNIVVAHGDFEWDDVGSWFSLAGHFPPDGGGNTRIGNTDVFGTTESVIVSGEAHRTVVAGLSGVVVVHTPHTTLVCSREIAGRMKALLREIRKG